jgi:hypothetical protein
MLDSTRIDFDPEKRGEFVTTLVPLCKRGRKDNTIVGCL